MSDCFCDCPAFFSLRHSGIDRDGRQHPEQRLFIAAAAPIA
jgi:hypothetical protein